MSKEKPRGKSVKFPKGNFHLKQGDYVVVIIDEPISVGSPESEWIVGAKVRAGNILLAELDEKDSKQSTLKITKKYEDYSAGIIFDNGEIDDKDRNRFIPKETSLRIYKDGHKSCKAHCTGYIKPRKSSKLLLQEQMKRKKGFKICRDPQTPTKLRPMKMVAVVNKIDDNGKFIDFTIGPTYKRTDKC